MSEYQYYEFRAIDRPLTQREMDELRALSTRATITPTGFLNVYNYGNFRGDPLALNTLAHSATVWPSSWNRWIADQSYFMQRLPDRVNTHANRSR
jgi:hypothetical protein